MSSRNPRRETDFLPARWGVAGVTRILTCDEQVPVTLARSAPRSDGVQTPDRASALIRAQRARSHAPAAPFQIADGLYYVGTADLASYLFVDKQGMILLDGGLEASAPLILDNIESRVRPASDRPDLVPVYSFNDDDVVLVRDARKTSSQQIRAWRDLLAKLEAETRL